MDKNKFMVAEDKQCYKSKGLVEKNNPICAKNLMINYYLN